MISKSRIKFLSSLSVKKYRESTGFFLVQGEKAVTEILQSKNNLLKPDELFATDEFLNKNQFTDILHSIKTTAVSESELKKISTLSSPNKASLLIQIPVYKPDPEIISNSLSLVLEDIRDPGNLGTIIRTADWFNIKDIFCSRESTDLYNPKTVQSTMGSITRVRVHYCSLTELFIFYREKFNMEITGTMLEGEELFSVDIPEKGMIVFGNESQGISDQILPYINRKISIPSFSSIQGAPDSLNIASAAAIICWEIKRSLLTHSK